MASGLFRYDGKRIKKKNLIKNHFQGYSLYCKVRISYLRYDRNRKTSLYRILIAEDVEYLRCYMRKSAWV